MVYPVATVEEKKKSLFFRLGMYGGSTDAIGNQKFVSSLPLPESNSQNQGQKVKRTRRESHVHGFYLLLAFWGYLLES